MSARTLNLYRKWNKDNVEALESVLVLLDPSKIEHLRLASIIAGIKYEGHCLDMDIDLAQKERADATE